MMEQSDNSQRVNAGTIRQRPVNNQKTPCGEMMEQSKTGHPRLRDTLSDYLNIIEHNEMQLCYKDNGEK